MASHFLFPTRCSVGGYTNSKPWIAIIDDDESVCRALKRLVRSLGMEADTFSSGQAFIELIQAKPSLQVDCVVLDVQMPGVNGLQIQERLKKSGHRFPIVFITAHDDAVVRDQALAGGALGFLRKPFNDELLIETLRAALKAEAGSGSGPVSR